MIAAIALLSPGAAVGQANSPIVFDAGAPTPQESEAMARALEGAPGMRELTIRSTSVNLVVEEGRSTARVTIHRRSGCREMFSSTTRAIGRAGWRIVEIDASPYLISDASQLLQDGVIDRLCGAGGLVEGPLIIMARKHTPIAPANTQQQGQSGRR